MTPDIRRERVNINQAAAIAGVSRRTVYNWIEAGKLEYVRTAGGAIRIYVDTLLRKEPAPVPRSSSADVGSDVPGGGANP